MRSFLATLVVLVFAGQMIAQTNEPVRLALISEEPEAITASDLLTAQLSRDSRIHLLERDAVEKVYREQGLSAANRGELKAGRILGADGVLVLNIVRMRQTTNLAARLVAVKPGVILTDGRFNWPPKDVSQFTESAASYLVSFLPKLAVAAKDAIPLSVVNLRSADQSAEAQETERRLKLLAIQRLSRERQFFILERQRMQLLSEEKDLSSADSAFWNGSYLLEGVVDQNGYSKDAVTINARLTPPKGGAPLLFEVRGARTNFSEVINRLTEKVTEILTGKPGLKEWEASEEAAQYFEEAKWALRWGVFPEAQAAAESAWALGKQDMDCASARVQAYVSALSTEVGAFQTLESTFSPGFNSKGEPLGPAPSDAALESDVATNAALHPFGMAYRIEDSGTIKTIHYVFGERAPDPRNIDRATHALELYYQFSRTLPPGEPKAGSAWYRLGVENLTVASQVLQSFHFLRESQKAAAEKLGELRALARTVAEWLFQSPSVQATYFVGNRLATYDELAESIGGAPNIFRCKVKWACFWQEKPEQAVALYRQLMSSPVFRYIHKELWIRELQTPRLAAWSEEDQTRVPTVWSDFVRELDNSTNALWSLESKALRLADASSEIELAKSFTNFFRGLLENRDALITNNVDQLYLNWGAGDLIEAKMGSRVVTALTQSLQNSFYSEYRPALEAMDREYRTKTVPAARAASLAQDQKALFEKQKRYLRDNKPYEFFEFVELFRSKAYSKDQAHEIQALVTSYRSNLIARSQTAVGPAKAKLTGGVAQVGFLENEVNRILKPPVSTPSPQARVEASQDAGTNRVAVSQPPAVRKALGRGPELLTNILTVGRFLKVPFDRLQTNDQTNYVPPPQVFAQRWSAGKLLFDVGYHGPIPEFDERGRWKSTRNHLLSAIVIFNPADESWDVIECPKTSDVAVEGLRLHPNGNRHELSGVHLFSCQEDRIARFDFRDRKWQILAVPEQDAGQLFAVGGRLFAVGPNTILEIINDNDVRILASTRRRPAAGALDLLDSLGSPVLFAGFNRALCAGIGNRVFLYEGSDWHEALAVNTTQLPEVFEDAVIFRSIPSYSSGEPSTLWVWTKNQSPPELCLREPPRSHPDILNRPSRKPHEQTFNPVWQGLRNEALTGSAGTVFKTNLYFFLDHAELTNVAGHWTAMERNGYHAKLVCLSRDLAEPIVVPLKFATEAGQPPPLATLGEKVEPEMAWRPSALATTIHFSGNSLFFGQRNTPGLWAIAASEIEAAVAAEKKFLLAKRARVLAAAEQARKALLEKYDRNHNGILEPDEKAQAMQDPAFIESEWDLIDANHNGWLDPEEFVYFDCNQNKILEPKEQAGIEIAQHLMGQKLLEKFDANDDGLLDRSEFNELLVAIKGTNTWPMPGFALSFPDQNHDGFVDAGELETFLKQHTLRELRSRRAAGPPFMNRPGPNPNQPGDPRLLFKSELESYWHSPGNGVSANSIVVPQTGAITNRIRDTKPR